MSLSSTNAKVCKCVREYEKMSGATSIRCFILLLVLVGRSKMYYIVHYVIFSDFFTILYKHSRSIIVFQIFRCYRKVMQAKWLILQTKNQMYVFKTFNTSKYKSNKSGFVKSYLSWKLNSHKNVGNDTNRQYLFAQTHLH